MTNEADNEERRRLETEKRAYELYEARGGEHGRDVDDWLEAEEELRRTASTADEGATPDAGPEGERASEVMTQGTASPEANPDDPGAPGPA
jgi:hypothetical protein